MFLEVLESAFQLVKDLIEGRLVQLGLELMVLYNHLIRQLTIQWLDSHLAVFEELVIDTNAAQTELNLHRLLFYCRRLTRGLCPLFPLFKYLLAELLVYLFHF